MPKKLPYLQQKENLANFLTPNGLCYPEVCVILKVVPIHIYHISGPNGTPDVCIFDFTNLYAARVAARVTVRKGQPLLAAIVGDSLLEPFWPQGTGCAHGFLSAMDAGWMIRDWFIGKKNPLKILAEREMTRSV